MALVITIPIASATTLLLSIVSVTSADNYAENLCASGKLKGLLATKALAKRIEREAADLPAECKGKLKQATKIKVSKAKPTTEAYAFYFVVCCESGKQQILYMEAKPMPVAKLDSKEKPFKEEDDRVRFWDYKNGREETTPAKLDAWTTASKDGADVVKDGTKYTFKMGDNGPDVYKIAVETKKKSSATEDGGFVVDAPVSSGGGSTAGGDSVFA